MSALASRLLQDQNFNFLYNGSTSGKKTADLSEADTKRKHLSRRKALNDISNARKPSSLHSVKKDGSKNVISIEKDPVVFRAKTSKAAEKGNAGVLRKPLMDVTNSVKTPAAKQGVRTNWKSDDVLGCVMEERFLHNHGECIKAQTKALDVGYFLKSVGLSNDIPMQQLPAKLALPLSLKLETNNTEHSEIEMPYEEVLQCCSPACRSPQSPRAPYMGWENKEFSELMVVETPKLV